MNSPYWLVPNRVIAVTAAAKCDDAYVKAFNSEIIAMLNTVTEPVYVIIDVSKIESYPSAQSFLNMSYLKHEHMGRILTIGMTGNPVLRFMASLVARGMGLHVKDFTTIEEARAYLASVEKI